MEAIVIAVVGVLGAALGATLSSWLGAKEAVKQELRDLRLTTYPTVWARTSVVSRWPRTDADVRHLVSLHRDLRTWYYASGGLYLSENARSRYGELQELLEALVGDVNLPEPLPGDVYADVMDAASAFRTALTEDLQSRQQRSLLTATRLAFLHRDQAAGARRRLARSPRPVPASRHTISMADGRPDD